MDLLQYKQGKAEESSSDFLDFDEDKESRKFFSDFSRKAFGARKKVSYGVKIL